MYRPSNQPDHDARRERRELFVAASIGVAWAIVGFALAAALDGTARGQTPEGNLVHRAACRVENRLPEGAANLGSGTLIDVTTDGAAGIVLTCAHLFSEGQGEVVVAFADGAAHRATVIDMDAAADLAALEIANPRRSPVGVDLSGAPPQALTACGFGPSGAYRAIAGRVVGAAESPGRTSIQMAGSVRSGDSGGGAFGSNGQLVGVVWGEAGGVSYITAGGPLRRFVTRVVARRQQAAAGTQYAVWPACPGGQCPLPAGPSLQPPSTSPRLISPPSVSAPSVDAAPRQTAPLGVLGGGVSNGGANCTDCECATALAGLNSRLDAIEQSLPGGEDVVRRDELAAYEREHRSWRESIAARLESLASKGLAGAGPAATILGLGGPAAVAAFAATGAAGWLLGRSRQPTRRGAGGRRTRSFLPSTAT